MYTLRPSYACHWVVVAAIQPFKQVLYAPIHLGLREYKELVCSFSRHEGENIKEIGRLRLALYDPAVLAIEPFDIDEEHFALWANDHQVSERRSVAHRERNLIIPLTQLTGDRELRRPLCLMASAHVFWLRRFCHVSLVAARFQANTLSQLFSYGSTAFSGIKPCSSHFGGR
jgi:hypothetical protein